jgi:xanthine dehydrogenase molybdopterin-binding subunit B
MPPNSDVLEAPLRHVHKPLPHDSGAKHVQGSAEYIDDIPEPIGTLHIAVGGTPVARGTLRSLDLSEVRNAPGVVAVVTAADIPGKNDISPGSADEPVLVQDTILFHHQPVFAVAATSRDAARRAALCAKIEVDAEAPNVTVAQGRASGETVMPDYAFINGEAAKTIAAAPLRSTGKIQVGGQEHFYLEGQVALAVPGEDGAVLVYSSTQHPSEVQHVTARVLGVPDSFVTCRVRRMGGGFGGKETQATQWAVLAAVAARMTGRPCKFRLDRDADMEMTGKRHDFAVEYSVGYDPDGRIRALDLDLDARCGCSADCSIGVVDRAMFHSDNAYFLPESRIYTRRVKTNTVSNTAFELTKKAYGARVHLSAAGFYKTPKLFWDRDRGKGRPFLYFAYGAACSEVAIDILTGEMAVRRVDILHDVGRSINTALDIGQIEGAFVQGAGWLTTEELVYDDKGRLLTHAPSTYKIPVASDVPADFRVALFDGANREATIYRSKAVGEPPLMLGISVFAAIADAIHAARPGQPVALDAPATPEAVLKALGPVDAVAVLAPLVTS